MTSLARKPSWSKRFRGGGGVDPECVLAEIENAIANAHPELPACSNAAPMRGHTPILVLEASIDPWAEPLFLSSAQLPIYSYSELRIRQKSCLSDMLQAR
jgi:hypothetical protein